MLLIIVLLCISYTIYSQNSIYQVIATSGESFKNSNFQLDNTNVENGVYCDNTNPITITMPGKNAYWNNRHYFIKVLGQDVDIDPPTGVTIDNSTSTINIGGGYRSFQFAFTSDFQFTGKIFIIGDK